MPFGAGYTQFVPDPFVALCLADRAPTGGLASWLAPGKLPEFDLVITLGDLDYYAIKELQLLNQPRMGVMGNHCGDYFEDLNIFDMHRFRGQWRGWAFRGIEGSPVYKKGPHQYTDEQVDRFLKEHPEVSPHEIVLTHCPPLGCNDNEDAAHRGWTSMRTWAYATQPKLILHGHCYPDQRECKLGETIVHYVNGISLLRISDDGVEVLATDRPDLDQ